MIEEELRREKEKAQKYLDVAGVIFVVLDSNGRISLINKKGCEVLGYQAEEMIGKDWFDNFLPKRDKVIVMNPNQITWPDNLGKFVGKMLVNS